MVILLIFFLVKLLVQSLSCMDHHISFQAGNITDSHIHPCYGPIINTNLAWFAAALFLGHSLRYISKVSIRKTNNARLGVHKVLREGVSFHK